MVWTGLLSEAVEITESHSEDGVEEVIWSISLELFCCAEQGHCPAPAPGAHYGRQPYA